MARRQGRGRLSAIDRLPSEADDVVAWAAQELRARDRTQIEILEEFNAKLAELSLPPVSKSAFNRHSMRLASTARRLAETREIAAALADRSDAGQSDDLTIMVAEMVKTLVYELLEKGGEAGFTPKAAKEMADAIRSAASAQNMSADRRRKIEQEMAAKTEKVVDRVAKEAGLSAERAAQIRRDVLGVRS